MSIRQFKNLKNETFYEHTKDLRALLP
jgi:hypothetical protein